MLSVYKDTLISSIVDLAIGVPITAVYKNTLISTSKYLRQLLKIALQVICEFFLRRFLLSFDLSYRAMRPQKK